MDFLLSMDCVNWNTDLSDIMEKQKALKVVRWTLWKMWLMVVLHHPVVPGVSMLGCRFIIRVHMTGEWTFRGVIIG